MNRYVKELMDVFAEYAAAKAEDSPTFEIEVRAERIFEQAVEDLFDRRTR